MKKIHKIFWVLYREWGMGRGQIKLKKTTTTTTKKKRKRILNTKKESKQINW